MAEYTNFKEQPLRLLLTNSYIIDHGSIYKVKKNTKRDQSTNENILVSHVPLLPTSLFKNIEDDKEKLEISFCINEKWRKIVAGREIFANSRKIIDLAAYGLPVDSGNARAMTVYISDMLIANANTIPIIKSISHLGWSEEDGKLSEFVPFSKNIKFDGINDGYANTIKQVGSLNDWCNFIETFRLRNIEIRLMIDASFASALVRPCRALPFIVNLWGPSGCGKTVALKMAASVWGNPESGKFVRTLNSTPNALIMLAALLNSLPLCGDELQTLKNNFDNFDSFIYQLTEGIPRGRLTQDSKLDASMSLYWGNSSIFTGEEPIAKSNSGAGVMNRIIEIECTNTIISSDNGRLICDFISNNYGNAGKYFIEHLPAHDKLRHEFKEWSHCIENAVDATGKQAASMSLILVADDLVRSIFFKDEPALSPLVADTQLNFSRFLKTNAQVDITQRAYDYIINDISMNITKFAEQGAGKDCIDNKNEVWGKFIKDENVHEVLFNKSKLEQELKKAGFSFDACKKQWSEKNLLIKSKDGRYADSYSICGVKGRYVKLHYDE